MKTQRSTRAFGAGVVLGLVLGTSGMSAAALGYMVWASVSTDYKNGYVSGFFAMATLARNLEPGGWVDSKYPYLPKVRPAEWTVTLDELYAKPENQKYSVLSLLQVAAKELEKKYGPAIDPMERTRQQMRQKLRMLAERSKRRAEVGAGEVKTDQPPAAGTPEPGAAKDAGAGAKVPPNVDVASKDDPEVFRLPGKRERKWCRCDGTDPKVARALRQSKAEEAEKDSPAPGAPAAPAAPAVPAAP